jgi:hypothetical protein
MIEFIVQCFAVSLSIAVGIVFIYGSCKGLNRLYDGRAIPCGKIKVKNFVSEASLVDVKLSDGKVLSDQKFVGFADFGTQKEIPFQFKTWLVLESGGNRSFVKPETVRAILEKNQEEDSKGKEA